MSIFFCNSEAFLGKLFAIGAGREMWMASLLLLQGRTKIPANHTAILRPEWA
jgi:hypothetical protein